MTAPGATKQPSGTHGKRGSARSGCLVILLGGLATLFGLAALQHLYPGFSHLLASGVRLLIVASAIVAGVVAVCITIIAVAALNPRRGRKPGTAPDGVAFGQGLSRLVRFMSTQWCGGVPGSGHTATETRPLPPFRRVELSGMFDVQITAQQEHTVSLAGDDNILPLITTTVDGDTLRIAADKSFRSANKVHVHVSCRSIETISSRGACDVTVDAVDSASLDVDVSGAGDLALRGTAAAFAVRVSGAGDVDAGALLARKAVVRVSGAGDVEVYASEELDAAVSGAGDIRYLGNPQRVLRQVSGVGSIEKR